MSITKIQDGFYYCKQSDIDMLGHPTEGDVFCCLDSGAVYKGKVQYKDTRYSLIDVINKVDRTANPLVLSTELLNFPGRKFRIRNLIQNRLFSDSQYKVTAASGDYVRDGNHIDNSQNLEINKEYIGIPSDKLGKVDIFIMSTSGAGLSAGDVVIAYDYNDTPVKLYTSSALDASEYDAEFGVEYDDDHGVGDIYIEVKAGVECYLAIINSDWDAWIYGGEGTSRSNVVNRAFNCMDKAVFSLVQTATYAESKNKTIYDTTHNDTNVSGKLGYIDTTKYAYDGTDVEELIVPDWAKYVIATGAKRGHLQYPVFSHPFFIAELLD